jgi:succinyl-diaminopimelate desuccinylase
MTEIKSNKKNIINKENIEKLLGNLIRIKSPYFHEEEIMVYVHDWLKERGIPVGYHHYEDKMVTKFKGVNVVGEMKGGKPGKKILINGHMDSVQLCEGWTKDPLEPLVEDGRMYGLGSLDMKSGSAAAMLALEAFSNTVENFNGTIAYNFVSDEEGPYGLGTNYIIDDNLVPDADVAIVPEPSAGFTGLEFPTLCLGARGGYSYTVEFTGKSAHAANPKDGICAIEAASKVIMELKKTELREDPYLGKGDICVIDMSGGGAACSVADKASFTVFRHIVMGENKETLIKEVEDAARAANIDADFEIKFREAPTPDSEGFLPYRVDKDNEYSLAFIESVRDITGKDPEIAYFQSIGDFCYIGSRLDIPTFVFGPGGENYHGADEYVVLDDVVKTAEIIYDYLVRILT